MSFDPHKNLSRSTVGAAPTPADSGTSLVLATGEGALFPATALGAYNVVVWPNGEEPTQLNAEIVRVTVRVADTLTITRQQEGTSPRTIVAGDQVALLQSAKAFTDIEMASLGGNSLTPTALNADQNDWSPTGWSTGRYNIIRAAATGAARTITGLAAGVDGQVATIQNIDALDLNLAYESGSSSAANRFVWGSQTTLVLRTHDSVTFIYDGTLSRWRMAGSNTPFSAWTTGSYANGVVTAESGSLTTCTASFRYKLVDNTLWFQIVITITTKGTGALRLIFPCPASLTPIADSVVYGQVQGNGKAISARSFGASFYTSLYDGSTPIVANGDVLVLEGTIEVA